MRIYEWLLKELTQRKSHKANIEVSIADFNFMLMLEKLPEYNLLNHGVLKPISSDLNTYSNMKLSIEKRGHLADTPTFQCELDKQTDLVTELAKDTVVGSYNRISQINSKPEIQLHNGLKNTLHDALTAKIQLTTNFEAKFLNNMQSKHDLKSSFS